MKKVLTWALIIFISNAFCFDTVKFLVEGIGGEKLAYCDDFQSDGKEEESKVPKDFKNSNGSEDGESDSVDDWFLIDRHNSCNQPEFKLFLANKFESGFTSDYCQEVYCPPES